MNPSLRGGIVVENNFLHTEQIDAFAAKAKGCETRGDCKQIVKEMEDLSLKQQEMIAVCATSPVACKEKYGDIPANGMLVREAIDRVLGDDVPSKMKNDMSSLLAQQIEAEGVVSSTEFANELKNRYGIDSQQADIVAAAANLSRDAEHAHQTLSPIFDREKEQNRLREAQLIGEIGSQVGDIVRTQGDLNGLNAAKEKHPGLGADELRKTSEYKAEMQKYGTGSAIQQGIQAATAAVQGLAGGNVAQAVSGAAAPYLAEQIHRFAPDEASRAMVHAVVGAVTSWAAGNGAAAGIAGGLTGGSSADTVAGTQAGKNSVENNFLSSRDVLNLHKELEAADKTGADKQDIYEKYAEISKKNRDEAVAESCSGIRSVQTVRLRKPRVAPILPTV